MNFANFAAWVIAVVVGVALLAIIIALLIGVIVAFRRRSALSKSGSTGGHYSHLPMGTFSQTDFNPTYRKHGLKVDQATMTKKSLFSPAPPPARKSEDYYALKADEARRNPPVGSQNQQQPHIRMVFGDEGGQATRHRQM